MKTREKSLLVVDIKNNGNLKKDLIQFGTEFNQDSVTYSKPNGDYYLISTNKCKGGYPGKGKIGIEIKLGKPLFGEQGEFHSIVNGRPFIFKKIDENFFEIKDYSIAEIRSITELAKEKV